MKSRVYRSRAVDRAVDVIQAIGSSSEGLGLAAIGRATAIPLGTLVSILGTLADRSIVYQLPNRKYMLDAGILQLSMPYHETGGVDVRFHEVASALVESFNETVQLGVLAGAAVVYVARVESSEPLRMTAKIGRRVAAHASATGKALLAQLDPAAVPRILGPEPLPSLTPRTRTTYALLERDLSRIRRTGVAVANEECVIGLSCVAAPVRGSPDGQGFALAISTPTFRATPSKRQRMAAAVVAAAEALSTPISHERVGA